jgi:hypothetical protein
MQLSAQLRLHNEHEKNHKICLNQRNLKEVEKESLMENLLIK